MKIGIVGSRRRTSAVDRQLVFDLVKEMIAKHGDELVLVSGGCPQGADGFTEQAADYFGVSMLVHYPAKEPKAASYSEATKRFYARNKKIARDSDHLYALVMPDRTGGSENTVKYMLGMNKPVTTIDLDGGRVVYPVMY
jgi:hypothetical protein